MSNAPTAGGNLARWAANEAGTVIETLTAGASPERREHAAGYMPSTMRFVGAAVPQIRREAKRLHRELKAESVEAIIALVDALVDSGVHEARQAGYELLALRPDAVEALGESGLERIGGGNDNWASVDAYACLLTGRAWREGLVADGTIERWARSEDPWWRRSALVSTIPLNLKSRGGSGDPSRTLRVCEMLVSDRHATVVKALSWALRSLIGIDSAAVRRFLRAHADSVAPRVRREVENKLNTGKKNPVQ